VASRIYTDTSVIGGCEDEEFRVHSRRLMDRFITGDAHPVLSELVLRELDAAPPAVRDVVAAIPTAHERSRFGVRVLRAIERYRWTHSFSSGRRYT